MEGTPATNGRSIPEAESGWNACPHVNSNDIRCASRFQLGRIDQAFSVCFGSYHGCPMYHRINAEGAPPTLHIGSRALNPGVESRAAITTNGHTVPLRQTGT
jgi:hypothetical protein